MTRVIADADPDNRGGASDFRGLNKIKSPVVNEQGQTRAAGRSGGVIDRLCSFPLFYDFTAREASTGPRSNRVDPDFL